MKGDLEHYNGIVCEAEVNKGSAEGWLVKPNSDVTMVLNDKNIDWTRCEETVNIEDNYSRSTTTGRNVTSCKAAMESVCSQFRAAVKNKYVNDMLAARNGVNKGRVAKMEDAEYVTFIHAVFEQFDLDNNKSIDKEEFLTGLFSLGVKVTGEEADMIMSLFGAKNKGFTYDQFCRIIISGDATRRRRSQALPALQRSENIAKMNIVSKNTRQARIKKKTAGNSLYNLK
jgi:hypothetical protein